MEKEKIESTEQRKVSDKKEKKPLTEEQRIKRNKMIAIPCMYLLCGLVLWFIFMPSASDGEKGSKGFNMEMPDAEKTDVEADKRKAYSKEELANRQKEKGRAMNTLGEYMADADSANSQQGGDFSLMQSGQQPTKAERQEADAIRSSAEAYQNLNTTLGGFYEQPQQGGSSEDAELRKRLDELEASMMQQESRRSNMDEQVALMEKSYQLAAKYMPGGNANTPNQSSSEKQAITATKETAVKGKKAKVTPVKQVQKRVVSSLNRPMGNEEFVAFYTEKASARFNTAIGKGGVSDKNTISACIHGNQTITDGQAVRLRLLEAMRVGEREIPRNAVIVGMARLQGERLAITLKSIEHGGTIMPIELSVYDNDGQEGIFIPKSMEVDAAKEVGANMGSSLNSSINISSNAGAQLASDLGKGVIQGVSQYISKKMRTVKIHLKAGYKVMLYQEED